MIALAKSNDCIDLQGVLQVLINFHYRGLVAASIAVVGSYFCVSDSARFPQVNIQCGPDSPEKMVTTFLSCDQL